METACLPRHVGVIMDGNGRWAKARGLARIEGHRRGAEVARKIVRWAADAGIREISLYAFSTENWARPQDEVRGLMAMLATLLPREIPEMQKEGVRLVVLGDWQRLPPPAREAVSKTMDATASGARITLVLCLNYGGQQEIVEGAKAMARWAMRQPDPERALEAIDGVRFRDFLWRRALAPVDLIIRTGGEMRISNFHLWDAAYAELYFTETLWPDFTEEEFKRALADYARRERRFGRTSEQVRR